jgi:RimJ/RimL family protein N-acetyltransferase
MVEGHGECGPGAYPAVIPSIETSRLRLRPWREGDLDAYLTLTADPEVMRYLGYGETFDREGTWRQIALFVGHWALRGYGFWAVEQRSDGAFIGRVGLWCPEGWPGLEVGWALARHYWNQGFASEAARASLDWGFRERGAAHIISLIYPGNDRSIRVAERIGERFERTVHKFRRECLIYGISRDEFMARGS